MGSARKGDQRDGPVTDTGVRGCGSGLDRPGLGAIDWGDNCSASLHHGARGRESAAALSNRQNLARAERRSRLSSASRRFGRSDDDCWLASLEFDRHAPRDDHAHLSLERRQQATGRRSDRTGSDGRSPVPIALAAQSRADASTAPDYEYRTNSGTVAAFSDRPATGHDQAYVSCRGRATHSWDSIESTGFDAVGDTGDSAEVHRRATARYGHTGSAAPVAHTAWHGSGSDPVRLSEWSALRHERQAV